MVYYIEKPMYIHCCLTNIYINKCSARNIETSMCLECGKIHKGEINPKYPEMKEYCTMINRSLYNFLMEVI